MAAKQPKWVRNLQPVGVRVRFSSRTDPFHFTLAPRGARGDVYLIPANLLDHPDNVRNIEVGLYEFITKTAKEAIDYANPFPTERPQKEGDVKFGGIVRPEDVTVGQGARIDENGNLVRDALHQQEPHQGANVDEVLGPKRAKTPGTEDFGPTAKYLQRGVVRRKRADG